MKISINDLTSDLKNKINNAGVSEQEVIEIVENNLTGQLSNLQTNNKNNIIDAINELFQNANNGKELIATAIGEPLNSNDTFNAMSEDINGLLNTFKINMMNNGATVESSDKFKQLIDKVATIYDDDKGIQFAEGTYEDFTEYLTTSGSSVEVPCNLSFKPTLIFVKFGTINNAVGTTITNAIISNRGISQFYMNYNLSSYLDDVSSNSFSMIFNYDSNSNITFKDVTWYAIGIGKEDTALRDSLASILKDEGVNVTEKDDMASLINKTDNEFQENTTILYNKMKDANYDVNSSMNMDTLLNKLVLKSKIKGDLTGQGIENENIITFSAKDLEFTPSLVYVTVSGLSEQIDVTESMYYNTLVVTNENIFTGASSYNTIEVNILNNGFEVRFISGSSGGTYNSLGWTTINTVSYIAIR